MYKFQIKDLEKKIWEIDLADFIYLHCIKCNSDTVTYSDGDFQLCKECFKELKMKKKVNKNGLV
jgi:ribosomal protein S27E